VAARKASADGVARAGSNAKTMFLNLVTATADMLTEVRPPMPPFSSMRTTAAGGPDRM